MQHIRTVEEPALATQSRRPTLDDLASALGLSANTVSRALSGKDGVSRRTRELVTKEAVRIGYVASPSAPSASRTIALTVTSASNAFITDLIGSIEAACRTAGHPIVLRITEESRDQEASAIESMLSEGHAGAIVIPVQGDGDLWTPLRNSTMPIVALAREIPTVTSDFVGVDHHAAMYSATRHLLSSGARSVLLLDEDLETTTVAERRRGFEEAILDYPDARGEIVQVPARRFESSLEPWQPEEAHRRCLEVFDRGTDVDAIMLADDYYALGALRAAKERGISVPDDLLIMGYGDHAFSSYLTPALSSVDLSSRLVGEIAVSMLLQRIAGSDGPPVHRLVKPTLSIRESSVRRGPAST